ncbi:ATP-binding protein [Caulobacter segnis]|uniref:ATP-binding protein n=1 Tax=Caulobacter segnis TaxID=88688 RepID=UPI002410691A|nr:ATP-binding protein [Caulobacter segnis]MDG2523700.1 ATP-binding protein [Caulobacter segnis]
MSSDGRSNSRSTHATLQGRIAAAALVTTVCVLAAACLTFLFQKTASTNEARRRNHEILAQIIASDAAPAILGGDRAAARHTLGIVSNAPKVTVALLRDAQGRIIASHGDLMTGETMSVSAPVKSNGRTVGRVELHRAKPPVLEATPQDIALIGALFFGSAGFALLLANGLARRISAPMERLSHAMRAIAASGRFEPVNETARDDVVHNLTRSFNDLLGQLGANDRTLRRTMRELVQARDDAEAANRMKSHFLSNMSHEIRTPLNGVLAMAEVMAMGELSPIQQERLTVIRRSGEMLLSVLNDVLDLSKIEAGRLKLANEAFDLRDLVWTAADPYAIAAADKGLAFDVHVEEPAMGRWMGDPARVGQIVAALLSNAVKFTDAGAVRTRLSICEDGALELSVTDTGVGISEAQRLRLFERFVQADDSTTRQFGGLGLGLTLARELAEAMKGAIRVESRLGEGACFIVRLPLERAQAETPGDSKVVVPTRALRVLAADDNTTNQKVITAILAPLGVTLDIVNDGKAAIEACEQVDYDLVLLDIHMPVLDGLDAARAIREAETRAGRGRTPILAVTADASDQQRQAYLAAGMDGHVAKPIEVAKLYEAIDRAASGELTVKAA